MSCKHTRSKSKNQAEGMSTQSLKEATAVIVSWRMKHETKLVMYVYNTRFAPGW